LKASTRPKEPTPIRQAALKVIGSPPSSRATAPTRAPDAMQETRNQTSQKTRRAIPISTKSKVRSASHCGSQATSGGAAADRAWNC